MKINWKVRAKNPQWWLSVALAVVVPIGAYYGLTGSDVTSWGVFFDTLKRAVLNPYVCFTVLAKRVECRYRSHHKGRLGQRAGAFLRSA